MIGWQWHQMDHMQIICTSLQRDNQKKESTMPAPHHSIFIGRTLFLTPSEQCQTLKAHSNTTVLKVLTLWHWGKHWLCGACRGSSDGACDERSWPATYPRTTSELLPSASEALLAPRPMHASDSPASATATLTSHRHQTVLLTTTKQSSA